MTLRSGLPSFRQIVPLVLLLGCRLASISQAQFTDYGRWQFAGSGVWSDSINWENSHTVNQAGAYVAIRGTNGFRTISLTNYGAAGYMYFEPGSGTTNFYNGGVHNFYLNSTSFLPVVETEHDAVFTGTVQFATGFVKRGSKNLYFQGTTWNSFDSHRTTPVWIDQGSIVMNKGDGRNAIGSTIINGGNLISNYNEQIDDYAYIQLRTGSLNIQTETFTSLSMGGWGGSSSFYQSGQLTLTGADGYLFGNTSHPFSLSFLADSGFAGANFRFTAPAGTTSGGGIYFGGPTSFNNSLFDLGGQTRYWNVTTGNWSYLYGTTTVSNGTIFKYGAGSLELSGTVANSAGLAVQEGTVYLSKTAGVNAFAGDLNITGGIVQAINPEQISNSAHVYVYPTGKLYLQNETFGSLYYDGNGMAFGNSTTFTGFSPVQGASNASFVLMQNSGWYGGTNGITLNFNAPAGGGGFYSLQNAGFTNIDFNLGGQTRTFSLQGDYVYFDGTSKMLNGGLNIYGNLYLGGTQANNLNLPTTLNFGYLGLNKTNGVVAVGDLVVQGGVVESINQNQIADSATVTQNGGNVYLNNETLGKYALNSGGLYLTNGLPLTMTTSQQYAFEMTTGYGFTNGTLKFTGATGGGLRFNHNANGSSAMNTLSLDFNNVNREINVGNGFMYFNDVAIVNGGFTKTGAGELVFAGTAANTNTATAVVSAGTLTLAKPNNVNALGGNLVVNGGVLYSYGQNQIADNATVTQNAGNVYVNNETLGKYILNDGGFYLMNGLPMTMTTSQQFAFEMTTGMNFTFGTLKFTGATGGGLRLNHNANGSSAMNTMSLDFNNVNREINVVNGFMNFNDVAIVNGGFTKTGGGELVFAGTAANTNSATSIVSAGTLTLAKPNNVNALGGDLVVNGGVVYSYGQNQIADNATVTQTGGTIYFQNETFGKYVLNGGGFGLVANAPLTLTSTSRYAFEIATGYTFNGGTIRLTGSNGGGLAFNTNAAGTTTWNNITVDLGNKSREISSGAGTVNFNGVSLTNGGVRKTGAGTLFLNGPSTYAGGTRIEQGTLSVGNTIGSATGAGNVEIVKSATLTGSGSIAGRVAVGDQATIAPGANVGRLTVGSLSFANSSNYNWQLRDATGVAGIGYDTIQINGVLDLTGSRNVLLNMWTVQSNGMTTGLASHFDSANSRSWLLALATGGILGWDEYDFKVVADPNNGTGGFLNPIGAGKFHIRATASQLWLDFNALGLTDGGDGSFGFEPAPEPTQIFAICAAMAFLGMKLRRRAGKRS